MRLIPLTQGFEAMVDDADYPRLSRHNWCVLNSGRNSYAVRSGRTRLIFMHKSITGYPMTDHIDGDGLNNQRGNLRRTDYRLNAINTRKKLGPTSSRFKGVSWDASRGRWKARYPTRGGRSKHIGLFDVELEAALAVDKAVLAEWGDLGLYNVARPGQRSVLTGKTVPPDGDDHPEWSSLWLPGSSG